MTDIKFRAWDTKNKEWITRVDVQAVHDTISWGHDFFLEVCNHYDDSFDIENWDPTRYIVCQGTGLHDKNGKEIYEGDITKATKKAVHKIWIVKFGEWTVGESSYESDSHEVYGWYMQHGEEQRHVYGEVIGNVWETPELLKQV